MYPIPEGQTVPCYITGNTSILNATIKIGNPIAVISIIASMLQVALSFGSILPVNDKTQERIRLAQNILFALLLILCFLSSASVVIIPILLNIHKIKYKNYENVVFLYFFS